MRWYKATAEPVQQSRHGSQRKSGVRNVHNLDITGSEQYSVQVGHKKHIGPLHCNCKVNAPTLFQKNLASDS